MRLLVRPRMRPAGPPKMARACLSTADHSSRPHWVHCNCPLCSHSLGLLVDSAQSLRKPRSLNFNPTRVAVEKETFDSVLHEILFFPQRHRKTQCLLGQFDNGMFQWQHSMGVVPSRCFWAAQFSFCRNVTTTSRRCLPKIQAKRWRQMLTSPSVVQSDREVWTPQRRVWPPSGFVCWKAGTYCITGEIL